MAGWTGSTRRASLPAGWHLTQPRILARDGYQCQHYRQDIERRCLLPARDVDHIVNNAQGGSDADDNLEALCKYHHGQKSGSEGGKASAIARRARKKTEAPRHPGLLP